MPAPSVAPGADCQYSPLLTIKILRECGFNSTSPLDRHARSRQLSRERRWTAVVVELEPNHDRQNRGGLVRPRVWPP